jgi:hypothetical protein
MPVTDKYPTKSTKASVDALSDDELKLKLQQEYTTATLTKNNFPTEIVELPSKGYFYPEGHPLSDGKVEMRYMTARDEDILSTKSLIENGTVFDRLCQSLLVTKFNYDDLLIADKNALFLAARILAYGNTYTRQIEDPFDSENIQTVDLNLSSLDAKDFDFAKYTKGVTELEYTLPRSGRTVTYKFITHGDESKIKKHLQRSNDKSGIDRESSTRLKYLITSVDGDRDTKVIHDFVDNELFSIDSMELKRAIVENTPVIDMSFTFESKTTGNVTVMEVPIGIDFFWPNTKL